MLIRCPWCGERDLAEFEYAGAALDCPAENAPAAAWQAYLYQRHNPVGWRRERWRHAGGCRTWFVLERHTLTHATRAAEEGA